jgi:hypothetical protein
MPGNHRYDAADGWLDFMEAQGIPVRGHTIFWGEKGDSKQTPTDLMHDPDWVEALGTNALYWIEQRPEHRSGTDPVGPESRLAIVSPYKTVGQFVHDANAEALKQF